MKLKALRQLEGFFRAEALVEGACSVCVQIILHYPYLLSLRILCRQFLHKQGVISFGAPIKDASHSLPSLRLYCHQQRTRPVLLIGVVLASRFTCFHRQAFNHIAYEKAGAFIEADYRVLWVNGLLVEVENILHARDESGVHLPHTPGLLQMRLQFVFLSICRALVCDRFSQIPSSTTLSASSLSVQRA